MNSGRPFFEKILGAAVENPGSVIFPEGDDARVVEDGTVHEVDVPHVCRILIDDVEVDVDLQELYRVYHHGDHVHRRGHRRLVDIIINIIIDLGGGEFLRGPFESEFVRGQLGEVVG